ncbi:MAG: DEAD/DEAH box helicase [Rubrivivax sp.]|nr:DEAD/DEAH box helicase [Rubrivivax sp.]
MPDLHESSPTAEPAPCAAADSGFAALGLDAALARAAAAAGWARPSAIQALAVPAVLAGRDVLALAPTGTGKTAAFLLPLLQRLLAEPARLAQRPRILRALILAPTRELAAQTAAAAHALAPQLKTLVVVGGVSVNPQMMALRGGAHLVVATPGRLLDLVARHALSLAEVALLVLDEADRLLDLGFGEEIGRVLGLLPGVRQTLMFSATMPDAVAELARRVLNDPAQVQVQVQTPAQASAGTPAIQQRAIVVDSARRTPLLRHLIGAEGWERALVFVATQYASEHVAGKLRQAGVPAAGLHGQLSAGRRSQALADFHARRLTVLVATDLAARGLDVAQMGVVVNHDLPRSAVDYTHRIGRTGRAAAQGVAVSFICADAPGSEAHFRLIEKRQGQRVAREQVPGFEPAALAAPAMPAADPHGGIKGRRKSRKDKLREAAARA